MIHTQADHPIQPLVRDEHGVIRFKANGILQDLFRSLVIDVNLWATTPFPDEDRVQLAQLLGYSLSDFAELPYVSDDLYEQVNQMRKDFSLE